MAPAFRNRVRTRSGWPGSTVARWARSPIAKSPPRWRCGPACAAWCLGATLYLPETWLTPEHDSGRGFRRRSVFRRSGATRLSLAAPGARRRLHDHGGARRCGIRRCHAVASGAASPAAALCAGDFVDADRVSSAGPRLVAPMPRAGGRGRPRTARRVAETDRPMSVADVARGSRDRRGAGSAGATARSPRGARDSSPCA